MGYERLEETADPELAITRALKTYFQKGYSKEWINQRLKSIEIRKALTEEWEKRGVKEGIAFAILTDEITKAWTGMTTKQYKQHKSLKKENLRDNMTNLELVLNMLAETAKTEISEKREPKNLDENKIVAREGGSVAGNARKDIEKENQQASDYVTKSNVAAWKEVYEKTMKAVLPAVRVGNVKVFFSRLGYHLERNGSFAKRATGNLPAVPRVRRGAGRPDSGERPLGRQSADLRRHQRARRRVRLPLIEAEMSRIMRAVS